MYTEPIFYLLYLINGSLPYVLVEIGITNVFDRGVQIAKNTINKLGKRFLKKEFFKKKLTDLSEEDLRKLLSEEFKEFESIFRESLQKNSKHQNEHSLMTSLKKIVLLLIGGRRLGSSEDMS